MGFRTLSEDLVEYGDRAVIHFRALGYVVRTEPSDIGYPSTPAMTCRLKPKTIAIHIVGSIDSTRLGDWCVFAKAAGGDFRVAVLLPEREWSQVAEAEKRRLPLMGIGVFIAHADRIEEIAEPKDLAINVSLPMLARLPRKHRQLLGSAYDHFDHGRWREGFDEACRLVESQARRYLATGIKAGRIIVVNKTGSIITPSLPSVRRMTLGALANTFKQIQNQTRSDVIIGRTLASINKDRVGRAHAKPAVEKRLRLGVGKHMHVIVAAFTHLVPI